MDILAEMAQLAGTEVTQQLASLPRRSLTIVQVARGPGRTHGMQSQSGRTECWLEGWIELPESLQAAYNACGGYCELVIQDGVLVDIVPDEGDPAGLERQIREYESLIQHLKGQLAETDYRILKCYESGLLGEELPYDAQAEIAARQEMRDDINAAEAEKAELEKRLKEIQEAV